MKRITINTGIEFNRHGAPISPLTVAAARGAIASYALANAGGVTFLDTFGMYRHADGREVGEKGWQIVVLVEDGHADIKPLSLELADYVRWNLGQESVLLTVEDVQARLVY